MATILPGYYFRCWTFPKHSQIYRVATTTCYESTNHRPLHIGRGKGYLRKIRIQQPLLYELLCLSLSLVSFFLLLIFPRLIYRHKISTDDCDGQCQEQQTREHNQAPKNLPGRSLWVNISVSCESFEEIKGTEACMRPSMHASINRGMHVAIRVVNSPYPGEISIILRQERRCLSFSRTTTKPCI